MSDTPNLNHEEPDYEPDDEHAAGQRAFVALGQYLEEDGWYPQKLTNKEAYRMPYFGKNGQFQCYAQVRVEAEQFMFYATAPIKVQEELRLTVAEYLTRANYGLYVGNFELDFSDGEVRYKSSIDFEGEPLSNNLIRNTIYPAVRMMDQYLGGLFKVIYSGMSPLDAIKEIEG